MRDDSVRLISIGHICRLAFTLLKIQTKQVKYELQRRETLSLTQCQIMGFLPYSKEESDRYRGVELCRVRQRGLCSIVKQHDSDL